MISAALGLAAAWVLLLAAAMLVARTPGAAAGLYAWAAVPQAALAAVLGAGHGRPELYLDAVAILAVKGLWAPRLLRRAVRPGAAPYGHRARLSAPLLFVLAAGVTMVAVKLGAAILPSGPGVAVGLALGGLLVGIGVAAVRPELWCQAAGLLVGEAGLATALLALSAGLPPAAEALALADTVALAAVLAVASRLVAEEHGAPDADLLKGLRG